jgi:hypothetical protein
VTNEPRLGSPIRFELDQSGAQSEALEKIGVSDLTNQMVRFWQIQSSPAAHADDGDMANHHPSGIWAREGKDHG